MDFFMLMLAGLTGAVVYSVVVRFIPGMQPGEAQINALWDRFIAHFSNQAAGSAQLAQAISANTAATNANTATVAAPAPASDIRAATAALALAAKPAESATSVAPVTVPAEQSFVQWVLATHPEAMPSIGAAVMFAATMPGNLTYADIWTAYTTPKG